MEHGGQLGRIPSEFSAYSDLQMTPKAPAGKFRSWKKKRQLSGNLLRCRNNHLLVICRASHQLYLSLRQKEEIREAWRLRHRPVCVTKLRLILHIPSSGRTFDFPGSAKCLKYYSVQQNLADISTFGFSAREWLWIVLLSVIKQTSGRLKDHFSLSAEGKKASYSFARVRSRTPSYRESAAANQPSGAVVEFD